MNFTDSTLLANVLRKNDAIELASLAPAYRHLLSALVRVIMLEERYGEDDRNQRVRIARVVAQQSLERCTCYPNEISHHAELLHEACDQLDDDE